MASILLGNVKGPQGDTGATGPKGDTGNAATVRAGSVTTVPYGQNARVTNSGDEHEAVFDFVIPQGRPGEQTTDMQNLTLSSMTEPSEQFPIPAIGETGKVIFGKITKWFSDMTALVATKFPMSNVVNNLTTTASGYALDARQGKAINDGALFEVHAGVVYQDRIQNANIRSYVFNTNERKGVLIYGVFRIGSTNISPLAAMAIGLPVPSFGTLAPIYGHAADATETIHLHVNRAGSLCNGNQTLTAGMWYVCQGFYICD